MSNKSYERNVQIMGISASQARLLSITARLTSNEYQSQQVSNSKMRLAIQSQEASQEYLAALNTTQYTYMSFDAQGDAQNTALTANVLYQYSDMKNQYLLSNPSGQVLLLSDDARNYRESANLDAFLEKYGIKKVFKSKSLEENYNKLNGEYFTNVYNQWEALVKDARLKNDYSGNYNTEEIEVTVDENTGKEIVNTQIKNETYGPCSSDEAYKYESHGAYVDFRQAELAYKNAYDQSLATDSNGEYISATPGIVGDEAPDYIYSTYINAQQKLWDCSTYQTWLNAQAMEAAGGVDSDLGKAVTEYYEILSEFTTEAEDLGCTTLEQTYTYSDEDKAKWYTNLWYRLNGESSIKNEMAQNNVAELDHNLASSSEWIQDCLKQGIITIEAASNENVENVIQNEIESLQDTLHVKLNGIKWESKIHTSCQDITQQDNDTAIARAEADYERKNREISAKDLKYQNKIKLLDTEHTTLEKEYESVKSALDKNVGRSFKTFNS